MAKKTEKAQKTDVAVCEPYRIVFNQSKYVIVLGNAIVSQLQFVTEKDAIDYIHKKPYELIFNSVMYLNEQVFELKRKEVKK